MKKLFVGIGITILSLFVLFIILGLNGGVLPNICKLGELIGLNLYQYF